MAGGFKTPINPVSTAADEARLTQRGQVRLTPFCVSSRTPAAAVALQTYA